MCYKIYGNVHTAKYYIEVNNEVIERIIESNQKSMKIINEDMFSISINDISIYLSPKRPYITIFVDFIKLLKKNQIDENDAELIDALINNNLQSVYPFETAPILKRVDLRIDIKLERKYRGLYLGLISEALDKRRNLIKHLYHEESVYFKSNAKYESVRLNLYDKPKERINKQKKVDEYNSDVLRLEIQLLNRHLNYMEKQYGISKKLENYLGNDCRGDYIKRYLIPVLFSGNYMKLKICYEIINKSNYKDKYKSELKVFLRKCKKSGVNETKKFYSQNKWRKLILFLEELQINPILIPDDSDIEELINPITSLTKK